MTAIIFLIIIKIVTCIVMVKRNKKLLLFYVRDFLPAALIVTSPVLIVHYFGMDCLFCVICALTVVYLIRLCLEVKKNL